MVQQRLGELNMSDSTFESILVDVYTVYIILYLSRQKPGHLEVYPSPNLSSTVHINTCNKTLYCKMGKCCPQ